MRNRPEVPRDAEDLLNAFVLTLRSSITNHFTRTGFQFITLALGMLWEETGPPRGNPRQLYTGGTKTCSPNNRTRDLLDPESHGRSLTSLVFVLSQVRTTSSASPSTCTPNPVTATPMSGPSPTATCTESRSTTSWMCWRCIRPSPRASGRTWRSPSTSETT